MCVMEKRGQTVIVFRNELLPFSQTYILNQMEAISNYRVAYFGLQRCEGACLDTPEERTWTLNSKYASMLFKFTSWVPHNVLKQLGSLKPLLVHAHFAEDGFVALPLAKKLAIPLVTSFHGSDYELSATILLYLLPILLFRGAHYLAADALTGAGYQGRRSAIQLTIAIFNYIANIILIPLWGWQGAWASSVVSDLLLVVILWSLLFVINTHRKRP